MLAAGARRVLPTGLLQVVRRVVDAASRRWTKWHLAHLRKTAGKEKPGSLIGCQDYWVRINDGPNFYALFVYARRLD